MCVRERERERERELFVYTYRLVGVCGGVCIGCSYNLK